jgi:DNA-3-methyladenine glycosylase
VVESEGYPAAVLIRALEPVEGIEAMRRRRPGRRDRDLTSGPGKLTKALGVGPELQRQVLTDGSLLFVARGQSVPRSELAQTVRVGITKGAEARWRFYDRRSRWVTHRDRNAEDA